MATQTQVPSQLKTAATTSVFCSQYSANMQSASQDNSYPLSVQLSTTSPTTCTFDVEYGDYISGISLVCMLPAIVNVTTGKVNEVGLLDLNNNYRAIVPSAANAVINTALDHTATGRVVREGVAGNQIGVIAADHVSSLASERNTGSDFAAYFCDYAGARLIQCVQLLVNGKVRQSFTGSWLFVFNELYRTAAGKTAAAIGAADPSSVTDGKVSTAKKVEALNGSQLEIELPFFFSQSGDGCVGGGGGPFPRFQFSRSDAVQLRFSFNSLRSLVVNGAGLGDEVLTIVADRDATKMPVQTVTVADKVGHTSSVASYLTKLAVAPTRQDFSASDFSVSVRVREVYVDAATLKSQRNALYSAVVAQPHVSEGSTAGGVGSDIVLDTMKHAPLPTHSITAYGRLYEHTVTNNHFATKGAVDQLGGRQQPTLSRLAVQLGSTTLASSHSTTHLTKRAAATYANSVPAPHYELYHFPFALTNPFPTTKRLTSVPHGCVMLNAMKGTKVVATPNVAAFKDHSSSGSGAAGINYSSGRGSAVGNSMTVVCHTLMMNTVTITPDASGKTEPAVTLGVENLSQLAQGLLSN